MIKKYCIVELVLLLIVLSFFCTGCWNSKEVESLAIATVVGVDYLNENGSDIWTVSVIILNPVGQEKGGEQSSEKGGQGKLLLGKGKTLQEAVVDFSAHTSRTPYYGHISTFILGERVARKKMGDFTETIMRFWEDRPKTIVMVTKGTALEVLQTGPAVEKLFSKELKDLAMYKASGSGYSYGVIFSDFTAWLESPDRDAVATLINVVPPDVPDSSPQNLIEGLAVFQGSKLVGWLNKEETRGYLLLTQKISKGRMPITVTKDNKVFTYFLGISKSKIQPFVTGND